MVAAARVVQDDRVRIAEGPSRVVRQKQRNGIDPATC
jgi:hypothetical protein